MCNVAGFALVKPAASEELDILARNVFGVLYTRLLRFIESPCNLFLHTFYVCVPLFYRAVYTLGNAYVGYFAFVSFVGRRRSFTALVGCL